MRYHNSRHYHSRRNQRVSQHVQKRSPRIYIMLPPMQHPCRESIHHYGYRRRPRHQYSVHLGRMIEFPDTFNDDSAYSH